MPRFCANLSFLYPERPFLERFELAAADGFRAVEYLSPEEYAAAELRARLEEHGLEQVLFNAAIGDYAGGERGLASLPGREDDFRRAFGKALDYASVLGNRLIHVMAGLAVPGRNEPDTGEVNYPWLFALLDELGYGGWIGCEYRPRAGTSEGLGWARPWLRSPPG